MSETKYEGQINPGMYFSVRGNSAGVVRVANETNSVTVRCREHSTGYYRSYPLDMFRERARPVAPPDGDWKPYVGRGAPAHSDVPVPLKHKDLQPGDVVSVDSKYSHFVARITGSDCPNGVPFNLLAGNCGSEEFIFGWIMYCRVLIPAEKVEPVKTEYAVAQDLSSADRRRLSDAAKTSRLHEVAEVDKVTEMVPGGVYALQYRHIDGTFSRAASGAVEHLGPRSVMWFELEGGPSGGERAFSTTAAYEIYRVIRMKPEVPKAEEPKKYDDEQVLLQVSAATKDRRIEGSLRHYRSVRVPHFTYMVKVTHLDGAGESTHPAQGQDSDEVEARVTMMDRFAAAVGMVMDEDR
jgi:hypothetical protein